MVLWVWHDRNFGTDGRIRHKHCVHVYLCVVFCCGVVMVDIMALRWRHNDHAGVSNHQPHGCLLNRSFRRKSKKTSKLRVTGLCAGNSPGTGEFPAQMASYAENVSVWWRHNDILQGHFAATGSSYDSPITREANLKNMNEYVMWTYKQG